MTDALSSRVLKIVASILCVGLLSAGLAPRAAETLPAELSDQEFWKLSSEFSEANGFFRSDNLLSNEIWLQRVIPDLNKTIATPSVYVGVGPEQNFTYITALRPKMVFIVDIRRGNLDLQLMYKALFELSADRAEFVSKLFSRKRPEGLTTTTSALEMFAAFRAVEATEEQYKTNLKAIQDHLTTTHKFALAAEDLEGIEAVYHAFYFYGPALTYSSTGGFGGRYQPTYSDLMVATDEAGEPRSYLATEDRFQFLKDLEKRNLIVPVVGNFAGPKALRSVGEYVKAKGAIVSAFYLSNVEQYLQMDGLWGAFCRNVATMPLEPASTFIRSVRSGGFGPGTGLNSVLGTMQAEVKDCGPNGR
jgi:hypothetical protein